MALVAAGKVLRGKDSWAYIYAALGFVLAIEGSLVQMLVLKRPGMPSFMWRLWWGRLGFLSVPANFRTG